MSVIAVRLPPAATLNLSHGQSFTINGSGFGSKSRAVPAYLRDKCTATVGTVDPQWTAINTLLSPANQIQLHATPFAPTGTSIGAPHPFVSQIYAGLNQGNVSTQAPWTNYISKSFTLPTMPCVLRVDWLHRGDPGNNFGLQTPPTNLKWFAYGPTPGVGNQCTFLGTPGGASSNAVLTFQTVYGDNGGLSLQGPPDANNHNFFWPNASETAKALNPFNPVNGWVYSTVEMFLTSVSGLAGGGYVNYYENGILCGHYQGITDGFAGTTRYFSVGSPYWNQYDASNTTNWMYCADISGDFSGGGMAIGSRCATVVMQDALGNLALQDLLTWSGNTITGTVWKGACQSGLVSMLVTNEAGATQTLLGYTLA